MKKTTDKKWVKVVIQTKATKEKRQIVKERQLIMLKALVVTTNQKILKSITDDSYTQKQESLLDESNKGYRYGKMPKPNLKDGALVSFKSWLKDMNDYRIKQRQYVDVKSMTLILIKNIKSL